MTGYTHYKIQGESYTLRLREIEATEKRKTPTGYDQDGFTSMENSPLTSTVRQPTRANQQQRKTRQRRATNHLPRKRTWAEARIVP